MTTKTVRVRNPHGAIAALQKAIAQFPELRLCQLIVNATGRSDPYYVEDGELIQYIANYTKAMEYLKNNPISK